MTCEYSSKSLANFSKKFVRSNGCWLWNGGKNRDGYGQVRLKGRTEYAHRISWVIHNGPIPKGMCVCHQCDNPLCVRPDHLFLGTHAENMADMIAKNHVARFHGKEDTHTKLAKKDIRRMREQYLFGADRKDISLVFNVSISSVYAIVGRRTWRHVL